MTAKRVRVTSVTATYVYCVVRSDRRPVLRRVSGGVPGASPPRVLDAGGGLRLTWDEQAARASVEKAHRPGRRDGAATGVEYLARKRDMLEVNRALLAEAQAAASGLYRDLSSHASEARRRTSTEQQSAPGSRLLLDAAYLVPARRAGAFRRALRQRARKLEVPGVVVSLTGPWPPYNFISR